jgi:hypothetical protein
LLLDLERHRVVDLLPDRSEVAFARWLRAHPGVKIAPKRSSGRRRGFQGDVIAQRL